MSMDTSNIYRKAGDILLDLEPLFFELVEDHEFQMGEMLALVKCWIEIHYPEAIEEYQDDTRPIYFYGPKEKLIAFAKKLK